MDVNIGEVVSTVRVVDGDALLAPRTLEQIVQAVLRAVEEREAHTKRIEVERRIASPELDERGTRSN
jgi:hypothetical protein